MTIGVRFIVNIVFLQRRRKKMPNWYLKVLVMFGCYYVLWQVAPAIERVPKHINNWTDTTVRPAIAPQKTLAK
jgi:hypothetical protein